ncbi:MAG: TIGR02147 family protein [Deltaproteobacteria bacterium]|nr:TIGR02147 family protein [Deltaproteobacteria bacterium]
MSKSYLSLFLSNKRPPTQRMIDKLFQSNIFNEDEKKYVSLLIEKETAQADEIKEFYSGKLESLKKEKGVTDLTIELLHIISDWHYSAILEALLLDDLTEKTSKNIAKKLNLKTHDVRIRCERLLKLDLIKKKGNTYLRKNNGLLATPTEVLNRGLVSLHGQLIRKALVALFHQNIENRNITGMTMAVDPKKIPDAKQRIQKFSRELMQFLETGEKTKVYQLNVQLFELKGEENEN